MKAIVEVEVLNPKESKVNELISSKLSRFGASRATYVFAVSPPIQGLAHRTLERLQERYVILGWDSVRGVDIELPDDLQISIRCTDKQIAIALETKYTFQMESRTKAFSESRSSPTETTPAPGMPEAEVGSAWVC